MKNDTKNNVNKGNNSKNMILSIFLIATLVLIGIYYFNNDDFNQKNFEKGKEENTSQTDMNENPRKSETDTPKNNTKPSDNGNKNTNTDKKTDNKNNNKTNNDNKTPNTEANVPKDDQKKDTDVDNPTENKNSNKQTEVPKEDNNGKQETQTPSNENKNTGTTDTNKDTKPTNSSPDTGKNNGDKDPGSSNTGPSNNPGNSGNGDEDKGNTMFIRPWEYPKYGRIIKKIYFVKMTQDEIDRRYKASTMKDAFDIRGQGNIKSWVEGDTLYAASPKKIYFINSKTNLDVQDNYLWEEIFFGAESLDSSETSAPGGGYPYLEEIDFANVNTRLLTYTGNMFNGARKLKTIKNFQNFDTSNVTNMQRMFYDCWSLTSLDLSSFNTSKVKNMNEMFRFAESLKTIKFSSKFVTNNVTVMKYMFSDCRALSSLDLSNFNTSKVTTMEGMFSGCGALSSLDLSSFNTSKVTTMEGMFCGTPNLKKIYVSTKWSTSSLTSYAKTRGLFGPTYGLGDSGAVGGNGTVCSKTDRTATYARIDKAGSPGCLTLKT